MFISPKKQIIFRNKPEKTHNQQLKFNPYKTQNFRQKQFRRNEIVIVKKIIQSDKKFESQQNFTSYNKNVSKQGDGEMVQSYNSKALQKLNFKDFIHKNMLINRKGSSQIQQTKIIKSPEQLFRKTFCISQTKSLRNQLQNQNIQRPPTSNFIDNYRPLTRIRKISNIGQQTNNNFLAKYQILKELGKGTYGVVHLAKKKLKFVQNSKIIQTSKQIHSFSSILAQNNSSFNVLNQISQKKNLSLNQIDQLNQIQLTNTIDIMDKPHNCHNNSIRHEASLQKLQIVQQSNLFNQSNIKVNQSKIIDQKSTQYSKKIVDEQKKLKFSESRIIDEQNDQLVAIKVYQKFKMNKDPSKFKNIRKQITIMRNLCHPGITKLYQSVQSLTKISLVVQYGGSSSLLDYLKKNFPLTQQKVKQLSKQLLDVLVYLHGKNIVHRDVKLQNVLVDSKDRIKLIDYGFSTLNNKNRKLNAICGTPNFMPPQLLNSKEYYGEKADVWSFGVLVYVLAQGRHPFKSSQYQQLRRLVNKGKYTFKRKHSQQFQEFINKILKINSNQRPTANQILKFKWFQ